MSGSEEEPKSRGFRRRFQQRKDEDGGKEGDDGGKTNEDTLNDENNEQQNTARRPRSPRMPREKPVAADPEEEKPLVPTVGKPAVVTGISSMLISCMPFVKTDLWFQMGYSMNPDSLLKKAPEFPFPKAIMKGSSLVLRVGGLSSLQTELGMVTLPQTCHDLTRTCHNLTRICHNLS